MDRAIVEKRIAAQNSGGSEALRVEHSDEKGWYVANGFSPGSTRHLWPDMDIHKTPHYWDTEAEARECFNTYLLYLMGVVAAEAEPEAEPTVAVLAQPVCRLGNYRFVNLDAFRLEKTTPKHWYVCGGSHSGFLPFRYVWPDGSLHTNLHFFKSEKEAQQALDKLLEGVGNRTQVCVRLPSGPACPFAVPGACPLYAISGACAVVHRH